jgi:AraC-type DNA-binding domain-containing proteins
MNEIINSDLDKIEVIHRKTLKEMEMNLHFHNCYEMIYIKSGRAIFRVGDKVYNTNPGSIIFLSNLEKHELKVIEYPYERYFMLVNPEYLLSEIKNPVLSSIFRHRPEHFTHMLNISVENDKYVDSIINCMAEEFTNKKDHYDISLISLLNLLLVDIYRNYSTFFPMAVVNRTTATILDIQKYIDENSHNRLNLKEIAGKYFIDMYYLSRIFKSVTGYSFKEYIILQRISKAKNYLYFTTEDITQVGLHSGFNNTNHFIKLFKKYEGITPYQYRKHILAKDVSLV